MHNLEVLPKRRKKVVKFLTDNPHDIAILTVREIASILEVNPSTVVRACKDLGFNGFEELKNHSKEVYKKRLTSYDLMLDKLKFDSPLEEIIKSTLKSDIDVLSETFSDISWKTIAEVVERISNSNQTYIIGLEAARGIASFLTSELRTYLPNVSEVTMSGGHLFDSMRHFKKDDVVFGISFGRCIRQTVLAIKTAYEKDITTVTITDSKLSPLHKYSHIALLTASSNDFYFSPFIAAWSLSHALINCCAEQHRENSIEQLKKVREQWEEFKIFYD